MSVVLNAKQKFNLRVLIWGRSGMNTQLALNAIGIALQLKKDYKKEFILNKLTVEQQATNYETMQHIREVGILLHSSRAIKPC